MPNKERKETKTNATTPDRVDVFPNRQQELRDLFTQLARPGATIAEVIQNRTRPPRPTQVTPRQGYASEQFKPFENIKGVRNNPHLTEGVYNKLDGLSKKHGWSMETFLRVFSQETAGTFNPSIRVGDRADKDTPGGVIRHRGKPIGSATGIIQFIEDTAQSLGTSTRRLRKMSLEQQLEYVDRYLNQYSPAFQKAKAERGEVSLAEAYTSVLAGKVRTGDETLFRRGTKAYRSNSGVDVNKDGRITAEEAAETVRRNTVANVPVAQPSRRKR
jgi:hypothetical protein